MGGAGRGGRRWRGREWGRGAEVPLGGGGEAAPLRGPERSERQPGPVRGRGAAAHDDGRARRGRGGDCDPGPPALPVVGAGGGARAV